MVLVGWRRFAIILGLKQDECAKCGTIGPHLLVRTTWWFAVFFMPVFLLRFKHSMFCQSCGAETGIPVLQMLRGIRRRRLPLDRPRPQYAARPEYQPDSYELKTPAADYFDPVTPNPKRSPGAWYFTVWPVLVVGIVVAIVVHSVMFPPPRTAFGQQIDTAMQDRYGPAHDCWIADDGTVAGCKMQSGVLGGEAVGRLTICYFQEPFDGGTVHCRD